jgi:hypothetical protein
LWVWDLFLTYFRLRFFDPSLPLLA